MEPGISNEDGDDNDDTGFFYDFSIFCYDIAIFCYDHESCILCLQFSSLVLHSKLNSILV